MIEKQIIFVPEAAKYAWDNIEVSPIWDDGNGVAKVCERGEESYWSVYLHQFEGGVRCIADLPTEILAYQFAHLLKNAVISHTQLLIRIN